MNVRRTLRNAALLVGAAIFAELGTSTSFAESRHDLSTYVNGGITASNLSDLRKLYADLLADYQELSTLTNDVNFTTSDGGSSTYSADAQDSIAKLTRQIVELQAEVEKWKKSMLDLDKEHRAALEAVQKERDMALSRNKEYEKRIADYQKGIPTDSDLKRDYARLQSANEKLMGDNEYLKNENEILRKNNQTLRNQLGTRAGSYANTYGGGYMTTPKRVTLNPDDPNSVREFLAEVKDYVEKPYSEIDSAEIARYSKEFKRISFSEHKNTRHYTTVDKAINDDYGDLLNRMGRFTKLSNAVEKGVGMKLSNSEEYQRIIMLLNDNSSGAQKKEIDRINNMLKNYDGALKCFENTIECKRGTIKKFGSTPADSATTRKRIAQNISERTLSIGALLPSVKEVPYLDALYDEYITLITQNDPYAPRVAEIEQIVENLR